MTALSLLLAAAVETIVVTGRPLPLADGAEAAGPAILDAAALRTASGRPEDGLRALAGLQLFRESGSRTANPTVEGATARGLAGNAASRLLVVKDGLPQADPFFGSVAWVALSATPMASAVVDRGGGDPAAGPGGVAGTVFLETALPDSSASGRFGSRDSGEARLSAALPVAAGSLGLSAFWSGGAGFPLVAAPGPADVASRYRQWSVAARAIVPLGPETELQASLGAFDDRRRRGLEGADVSARGGDAGARLVHRGAWSVEAAAWGQLRDFATRTLALSADRATTSLALDQRATPASGAGARVEVRPPLVGAVQLRVGMDGRTASGETVEQFRFQAGLPTRARRAGGSTASVGGFAEAGLADGERLALVAGARLDRWSLADGRLLETDLATGLPTLDRRPPARHGTEAGGRLLAWWRPAGALRLRAAWSTSHRLPTLNELHRPFRVGNDYTAANPDLAPERSRHLEAGLDVEPLSTARLGVTLFRSRLAGAIANVTVGEGPGVFPDAGFLPAGGSFRERRNLRAIETDGIEAEAAIALGAVTMGGSLAVLDPRVGGGGLDGLRPAQAAQLFLSGGLGIDRPGFGGRLALRHVGARYEDDRNSRRLSPTTSLDASARLALGRSLALTLDAENLFDAANPVGFSGDRPELGQPRTLWVGLRWPVG